MSHRLDLAFVDVQRGLDDVLAVTCNAGMSDITVVRHLRIDILHDSNSAHYRIALVACIICVNKVALPVNDNSLCRCGSGINTEEQSTGLVLDVQYRDLVLHMTVIESFLIFLALEDRIDPDDVRHESFPVLELYEQVGKVDGILAVSRKCCA